MVFVTYAEYLTTTGWKWRSYQAKCRADFCCEICGASGPLEVHHLSYARVGQERDDDLLVLCEDCHFKHHGLVDDGESGGQMPLPLHDTVH